MAPLCEFCHYHKHAGTSCRKRNSLSYYRTHSFFLKLYHFFTWPNLCIYWLAPIEAKGAKHAAVNICYKHLQLSVCSISSLRCFLNHSLITFLALQLVCLMLLILKMAGWHYTVGQQQVNSNWEQRSTRSNFQENIWKASVLQITGLYPRQLSQRETGALRSNFNIGQFLLWTERFYKEYQQI